MAEAVFRHQVEQAGASARFTINSAGTGEWHVGELPHRGTRDALQRHGISPNGLVAKHVTQAMLDRADYVVAMDAENMSDLRSWRIDRTKLSRLLDYAPEAETRDVPDPYYDGRFELVYQLVNQGAQGLLQHIRRQRRF